MSAGSALKMTVLTLGRPWPRDGTPVVIQRNGDRVTATHGNSVIAWDSSEYDEMCLWIWMQMIGASLSDVDGGGNG